MCSPKGLFAATQEELNAKMQAEEKMELKKEEAQKEKRLDKESQELLDIVGEEAAIAPETAPSFVDTTPVFNANKLIIRGNALIPLEEILEDVPAVFNPTKTDDPAGIYDLTPIKALIDSPGQAQQVSARTIQGFTQYILSVYQKANYGGIYVYVPTSAIVDGVSLKDNTLLIEIMETTISQVAINPYNVDKKPVEKPCVIEYIVVLLGIYMSALGCVVA